MICSIRDANVQGKRVLVRLDLDVPIGPLELGSEVGDVTRLEAALPTLRFLLTHGATVVILGHAGRPGGEVVASLSLRPILAKLMLLLDNKYTYQIIDQPGHLHLDGTIFALENLRFHAGEETNDVDFSRWLANFGDIYVNDAFAVSHRSHASIVGVPALLPAYAGLHLMDEVAQLEAVTKNPAHPVVAVLGGAKVETKLPAVQFMSRIADEILLGGKLVTELQPGSLSEKVGVATLSASGYDISAESANRFAEVLRAAQTIIWNGPMGKFEESPYDAGTRVIAEAIAQNVSARRLVGGGDTLEALHRFGLTERVGYVSSGGGAMLDFLSGKALPGLTALEVSH
jgi:phosphoglycerate kinase